MNVLPYSTHTNIAVQQVNTPSPPHPHINIFNKIKIPKPNLRLKWAYASPTPTPPPAAPILLVVRPEYSLPIKISNVKWWHGKRVAVPVLFLVMQISYDPQKSGDEASLLVALPAARHRHLVAAVQVSESIL